MKVLNFGSLNIDYVYSVDHFIRPGETMSSTGMEIFCGGKGLNQSIALAKAGAKVSHAGAVGKNDGERLIAALTDAGVDVTLIRRTGGLSGHTIIQVDRNGQNCILLYGGANQEITEEQIDRTLEHFTEGDRLLLQNEISGLPYLMEQAKRCGMKIYLNPSPVTRELLEAPLNLVDCFILNEIEASDICASRMEKSVRIAEGTQRPEQPPQRPEQPSQRPEQLPQGPGQPSQGPGQPLPPPESLPELLHELYPQAAILLTLGENGSIYYDGTLKVSQPAFPVKAVDTTAAGDTFTGYFMAAEAEGRDVEDCLLRATKAAALAVSRKGASVSIPEAKEIEQMNLPRGN